MCSVDSSCDLSVVGSLRNMQTQRMTRVCKRAAETKHNLAAEQDSEPRFVALARIGNGKSVKETRT